MKSIEKISILINSFGRGGAEKSMYHLAEELSDRGFKITYVALWAEDFEYKFKSKKNLQIITLNKYRSLLVIFKFFSFLRKENPDLLYSAMFFSNLLGFLFLSNQKHSIGIKNNLYQYKLVTPIKFFLWNLLILSSKNIVFLSKKARSDYGTINFFCQRKAQISKYLYNPIKSSINSNTRFQLFDRKIKKFQEYCLGSNPKIIISIVGRLIKSKGLIEFANTWDSNFNQGNYCINIVGEGELKAHLIHEFKKNRIINYEFHPFSDKVENFYYDSDIILFTSLSEGFGRVPFEAVLNGSFVLWNTVSSIQHEFSFWKKSCFTYSNSKEITTAIPFFASQECKSIVDEISILENQFDSQYHASTFLKIHEIVDKK